MARLGTYPGQSNSPLRSKSNDGTTHRGRVIPAAEVASSPNFRAENLQQVLAEDAVAIRKSSVRSRKRLKEAKRRKKENAPFRKMTPQELHAAAYAAMDTVDKARAAGKPLPKVARPLSRYVIDDVQEFLTLPPDEYKRRRAEGIRPEPAPYIAKRMEYKRYVEERLTKGFVLDQACSLGDRPYLVDEFIEEGFRSDEDWTFRRFVWNTPAAANRDRDDERPVFLAGGKHSLEEVFGKTWGCDQSHIVRDTTMRRCAKFDLDCDFESAAALEHALRAAGLPILPQVGVGNRTLDGSIGGPHVWIELAGEPVWFSNHPSCRKEPLPTVLGARDKRHIANYWKFVEKYQVTRLSAVPSTLAVLAKSPPVDTDLSLLRPNFITGSTSLPVSVQRRFEEISGDPNARPAGRRSLYGHSATPSRRQHH